MRDSRCRPTLGRGDQGRDRRRYGRSSPPRGTWPRGPACEGQRESAGKRGSAKTRNGSKWLRTTLIEAARQAARLKGTYLNERYLQGCRRRGGTKAIVAVAHEILIAARRALATGQPYDDPGLETLRNLSAEHVKRRALAQLRALGYQVTIDEAAPAA